MTTSTKILRIKESKIYYTNNDFIDIKDTNIPYKNMSFSYGRDIFWEVELFNFENETKSVWVRVLDYSPENTANFYVQEQKKPVKFFQFEKFQWTMIEPQLSSYQISELSDIVDGIPPSKNRISDYSKIQKETRVSNENQNFSINEEFSFFYKKANFEDGFASVDYKSEYLSKRQEIKILNNKILHEYHFIRNYFPKYFKKGKKFKIQISGEIQFGKLINYEATSYEIQSIDEDVIFTVKNLIEVELFDSVDTEKIEKSVLSIDELIKESDLNSSIKESINKDPQKILNSIFKIKNVKNKTQLEYLAGLKQEGNCQLRFTLKPLFGFLFYVESGRQNHFCWELLNSHATYIWSFDSNLDFYQKLHEIDNIINYIRINGRKKYRQLEKSEDGNDFSFSTLYHKNKLTNFKDGFIEWKNGLEKILIKTRG